MSIANVSQITPVKGRYEDVLKNIKHWFDSGVGEVIIVDYDCPDTTAEKLMKSKYAKNPRLKIVAVSPEMAGPFYNHSRARNIGAQAARFEYMLFLNADSYVSPEFISRISYTDDDTDETNGQEDTVKPDVYGFVSPKGLKKVVSEFTLPDSYSTDSQLAIRNAAFHKVNGFAEENPGWAAETYDIIYRIIKSGGKYKYLGGTNLAIKCRPHNDQVRYRYLPIKPRDKIILFSESAMALYSRSIKCLRAQPCRPLGIAKPTNDVKLIRDSSCVAMIPGECD